ncbi:MAG: Thiol:disulfide interchange protein DsbD [Candidatus Heimdallarchaeota archaeon LC_2]|nr:MAG: Thiol:disulfide interchange protein DsbD [Candidatus Heimdallarchaeota archaeon LC_2]
MVGTEFLILNFGFGLLAAFSPCLFPLFPAYVALVTKSGHSQVKSFFSSLSLMLGVLLVFLALSSLTNNAIQVFLTTNFVTFAKIQGVFLFIAGVFLIRTPAFLSKIQIPEKFYNRLGNGEKEANPYYTSFLLGLLFTIIAAPCAGGYFFAVVSNTVGLSFLDQFLLVLMFSIGVGAPFMISSMLLPQFATDIQMKIGDAPHKISVALGFMLIAVSIWLFFYYEI